MERNKQDLADWVDSRIASLDGAGEWRPDAAGAWAVLRRRDRAERVRRAGWVGLTATVMAASLILFALGEPRACANPLGCAEEQAKPFAPDTMLPTIASPAPRTLR